LGIKSDKPAITLNTGYNLCNYS